MRLFTGIALPADITARLEQLVRDLRPTARIKWSQVANLHITTKFIGEWPEERLDEMKEALLAVPSPGPVEIAVRGVGWFPNPRSPRVLYAGIEAPDALHELARDTGRAVAELGVPEEKRSYSPHLTLARIKTPSGLGALKEVVENLPSTDFGTFTADRFHLYLSELRPRGSVYTSLAEFDL